jgi:transposase
MQLTERHIIKSTEHRFAQIDELAFKPKNLYNAANYVIRQSFIYGWGYVNYNEMNRLMKSHEAYKALPAKVSQQILMVLDKNWKSFFEAVKAYKADSSKFTGSPKLPKYKDKTKGRNLRDHLIFVKTLLLAPSFFLLPLFSWLLTPDS